MFGNNAGIQSSWANPQQNPQQPQQPQQPQTGSVFGQPSAFGASAAGGGMSQSTRVCFHRAFSNSFYSVFGSGGGFGSNPQQQPQPANSMFGNITSNPNPTPPTGGSTFGLSLAYRLGVLLTSSSSGAFGAGNNNPSLFNTTKPNAGFGTFGGGGTSAFNTGGGAFSSTNPSQPATSNTGLFGQPNATGSAFGTSTFAGNKPAPSAFGSTPCTPSRVLPDLTVNLFFSPFVANTNTGPYDGVPPVTTGTANPPYSAFSEKDPANTNSTLQYQSITCMPQYRGNSFEVGLWYAPPTFLSLFFTWFALHVLSSLYFHE